MDEHLEKTMHHVALHASLNAWDHAVFMAKYFHGVVLEDTSLITKERAEYAELDRWFRDRREAA